MTANIVQAYAADAASIADDSKVGPTLNQAAATGRGGSNPSNIARGVMRLFGEVKGAPAITWISIPFKNGIAPPSVPPPP